MAKRRKSHIVGYESRNEPVISRWAFVQRLAWNCAAAALLIAASLLVGMWGYHHYEGMTWIDSYANASMILSGMGPLAPMETWDGKMFAGTYALYSGLALILVTGLIFAPVVHRLLHRFHVASEDEET